MRQRKWTLLLVITTTVAVICASCAAPVSQPAEAPAPAAEPTESAAAPAAPPPGNALLLTLVGHTAAVDGLAVSQDGQLIASASGGDGSVRVWGPDGTLLHTFAGLPPGNGWLALSPDGSLLAVGMAETVWLWRLPDGQQLQRLSVGIGQPVTGVAFAPDGLSLVTTWGDGWVRLWRVPEGELADSFDAGAVGRGTALSGDGKVAAVATTDGMALVWRLADKSRLSALQGHTGAMTSLAFSPGGELLAAGEDDGDVRLWQTSDGALLATLTGHTGAVNCIEFNAAGDKLFSGGQDGVLRTWRVADGTLDGSLALGDEIGALSLSREGHQAAVGVGDNVQVWSLE